jgi:1,4-alpha-glucan branching enzyme
MADVIPHSLFTDFDIDLFKSGKHYRLYEKFGSHIMICRWCKGHLLRGLGP